MPVTDLPQVQSMLNQPLTEREKQLDEELSAFLREFSTSNKQAASQTGQGSPTASSAIVGQLEKYPYLEPSPADKPYTTGVVFTSIATRIPHCKTWCRYKESLFPSA